MRPLALRMDAILVAVASANHLTVWLPKPMLILKVCAAQLTKATFLGVSVVDVRSDIFFLQKRRAMGEFETMF